MHGFQLLIDQLQGFERLPVEVFDRDSNFTPFTDSQDCGKVPVKPSNFVPFPDRQKRADVRAFLVSSLISMGRAYHSLGIGT